jgi:hypothetical protein
VDGVESPHTRNPRVAHRHLVNAITLIRVGRQKTAGFSFQAPSVDERFDLGPLKPKSENLRKVKAG